MTDPVHISVLLGKGTSSPLFDILRPSPGDVVIDATLGLGGHSEAFLTAIGPTGRLIGMDADEKNLAYARKRLLPWGMQCTFMHANFRDLTALSLPSPDVLFADLGLSSPHIDDPERGFSFRFSGPLDLRFDQSRGDTAAEFLRKESEEEIARVLYEYGDIRESRRIAKAIRNAMDMDGATIDTTDALRSQIERVMGYRTKVMLPRIFQALRIAVNHELDALTNLLKDGPALLAHGGRMGIISYHSLEDRLVKQTFRALTTPIKNPDTGTIDRDAAFVLLTKKPVDPSSEEVAANPRARSAHLRAIQKR